MKAKASRWLLILLGGLVAALCGCTRQTLYYPEGGKKAESIYLGLFERQQYTGEDMAEISTDGSGWVQAQRNLNGFLGDLYNSPTTAALVGAAERQSAGAQLIELETLRARLAELQAVRSGDRDTTQTE